MGITNLNIKVFHFWCLLCCIVFAHGQTDTRQIQYLSGKDNNHTETWKFWCTGGRNSGAWSTIQVPSCWEQQGFGTYNYGRDYVSYGKNFRFANEKGLYEYSFNVPQAWKGKTVTIVFEGSMTDTEVKVNGKLAGAIHQGSFYRFTYDVTDKINFDKANKLEVTVSKMSADNSVNNAERLADYWIFGGIFRPVYLKATPTQHISNVAINALADGSFAMNVFLQKAMVNEVKAEIIDSKGSIVATFNSAVNANDTVVQLKTKVKSPLLWSAETPNLYSVKVTLGKNNDAYQMTEKFGFRTIEVRKGDGIYVNGSKIKMKGINRHVWWPETGRTSNAQIDLADVKLIKGMNMNAVRCSHYPPDKSFLRYCDSLGLYVLDELAGWQKAYSTKAGKPLVKEMVTRDCNHPSIIFWSNGNEGGHNFDLDDEYARYDLSARPVIHAHHKPGNAFRGIECNHYEDYYSTKKILEGPDIYMVTEFLHAQDDGGGAASLSDFWDLHWNAKLGAGGFIWALVDEGIVRTDLNNKIDVNGINAPDGVVGPYREKEGSYNAIKEIFSPVKITLKELPANFNGSIPVENRYNFVNLNQCTYNWELVNFNQPDALATGYAVAKKGSIKAPSIKPTEKGNLKADLPKDWKNYDALTLSAYDNANNELYKWTWKIKQNKQIIDKFFTTADAGKKVIGTETDSTITVKAHAIGATLSKKTGLLVSLSNTNSKSLTFNNGPVLVGGSATFTGMKSYPQGDNYVIESSYTGDMKKVVWTMYPSGWLEMAYEYTLDGTYPYAGVSFNYPENYVFGAKWLGDGPYRVWKNRMDGSELNVWKNMYNETHAGRSWIFPEFKGYFSDVVWVEMDTAEGKFTIATEQDNMFLRLFDFYALSGPVPQPPLPQGNISFLDRIPPIGGKLSFGLNNKTALLGPLGEPNVVKGTTKRTLYFYFGLPDPKTTGGEFTMPKENILTDEVIKKN